MRKRRGFTLVELLVVMALVLLIMVILAKAFGDSLKTLQRAKAIGDMQEKLRAATGILRRDLAADHFDGRLRVSDWDWNWSDYSGSYTPGTPSPPALPPPAIGGYNGQPPRRVPKYAPNGQKTFNREGCFNIFAEAQIGGTDPVGWPRGSGTTYEGTDLDNQPVHRVTQRRLHFTVKLRGNNPKDFFSAKVPPGLLKLQGATTFFGQPDDARFQSDAVTYNSQWAEVYYYLQPNGSKAGSTDLFTLYRGQYVLVPNNSQLSGKIPLSAAMDCAEFSCKADPNSPGTIYFNTPVDMANGGQSELPPAAKLSPIQIAKQSVASILIDDVLSFQIIPWTRDSPYQWDKNSYSSASPGIPLTQYQPAGSWTAPMDGVRITIRVWDNKSGTARQVTIFQDL